MIMAHYTEMIDLYSDDGKLLKSDVLLHQISPLLNPAAHTIIDLTKRRINVNLAEIEDALKNGKLGNDRIPGRELILPILDDSIYYGMDYLKDKYGFNYREPGPDKVIKPMQENVNDLATEVPLYSMEQYEKYPTLMEDHFGGS